MYTPVESNYLIHDNGGRPFKVVIKNRQKLDVLVYNNEEQHDEPILKFESISKVFIGFSPLNNMTNFSGGYGSDFDGNSILLHLSENNYVFIGAEIFSFETFGQITKFISPVGNNDVPYPYAIDQNGNYYLLIEDVVIKADDKIVDQMSSYDDPYDYYYDYNLITADTGYDPPKLPKIPNFNEIKSFYIGKSRYTMTYNPFPHEYYDRVVLSRGKPMHVVDTSRTKTIMNKEAYIDLITSFGTEQNFVPIQKKILQKRLV